MDADFLLIHKMKNGDEEAIEVFVKKYYSTIRNYCRLHTYTDCDAEDITQATFEHFFRSFPCLEGLILQQKETFCLMIPTLCKRDLKIIEENTFR